MQGIRGIWHDEGEEEEGDTIIVEVPIGVGTRDLTDVIEEACGANDKPEDDQVVDYNTTTKEVDDKYKELEAERLIREIMNRTSLIQLSKWEQEMFDFALDSDQILKIDTLDSDSEVLINSSSEILIAMARLRIASTFGDDEVLGSIPNQVRFTVNYQKFPVE